MRLSLRSPGAAAIAASLWFVQVPAFAQQAGGGVRVSQTAGTFVLDNGVIRAVVSKHTGDLVSMTYKGAETLSADAGGHSAVYWSHDATGGKDVVTRITIDPSTNGGERAEVSVKGISGGIKMGHGPGTAADGDIPIDIDMRYSLGRDDRGVYAYVAFDHRPEYGTGIMAEARIAVELAKYFDDIYVDDLRSGRYPLMHDGADKYVYTTRQADERTSGWSSSTRKIGWFQLNPSAEYLSGGPNRADFTAHGQPTVLNYWKTSHYGGANVTVIEGERWTRVVGPFLFYVNEGPTHAAMVADAKAQLKKEEAKWPYDWVKADGYAPPKTRSKVVGQLVLDDRLAPNGGRYSGKLMVGLTATPYTIPPPPADQLTAMSSDGRFLSTTLEWQIEGKYLQFWSRNTDPSGRFIVPHVAPGKYTLHAYADGVLGEYAKADIVVTDKGGTLDLGRLVWTPVRHGRTVWEVGVADRDAREFAWADHYFEPGSHLKYGEMFPKGVVYRVGRSTPGKDWFFAQAPQPAPGVKPEIVEFSNVTGDGQAVPYRIVFDMQKAATGAATLRLAFTSHTGPGVEVAVNGTPVGLTPAPRADNAIVRHQMYGRYSQVDLAFDARLLKAGENTLTLTVPAGPYNSGVIYDAVRLELDEAAPTPPAPAVLKAEVAGPATDLAATNAARPAAAARPVPPSQVFTIHDDARFGLPDPVVAGRRYFAKDGAVFVQAGDGVPRELARADRLGPWAVSPDGSKLAWAAAETDAANAFLTIRVVDTTTGEALADEVKWARYTAIAWAPDSSGFYYSGLKSFEATGSLFGGAHEVFFHVLGDPESRRVLWSDRIGMTHYAEISDDGRWLVINGSMRADGKSEITLIDLKEPAVAPFKAMRRLAERWQFAGSNGDVLYFVTDYGAERGRLVSIDTSQSSLPIVEIIPQTAERLQAARLKDGRFSLSYAGAGSPVIRMAAARP